MKLNNQNKNHAKSETPIQVRTPHNHTTHTPQSAPKPANPQNKTQTSKQSLTEGAATPQNQPLTEGTDQPPGRTPRKRTASGEESITTRPINQPPTSTTPRTPCRDTLHQNFGNPGLTTGTI